MAEGMVQSVKMLIGEQEHLEAITFAEDMGADQLEEVFQERLAAAGPDEQWLVFCDLKGGTPFNVVSKCSFKNDDIAVIYGMNLAHGNRGARALGTAGTHACRAGRRHRVQGARKHWAQPHLVVMRAQGHRRTFAGA